MQSEKNGLYSVVVSLYNRKAKVKSQPNLFLTNKMLFPTCFILLSLIMACATAEASKFHKNQPPTRAKRHISEEHQRPSICNWLECPKYRVLKTYPGFEHREYDATQWVSTPVTLNHKDVDAGIKKLLQYMNGSNAAGMHLDITAPVVIMNGRESDQATMSIFLPAKLKNPPMPLNSTNYLQRHPKASLYVRSFSGMAKQDDYAENIKALAAELSAQNLDFDTSFVACNIYDPPSKLNDRYNEVWFRAA